MYFGTSQVSQEVERSAGKRTPRATSLRVLRVSVCIGPAHAEARRRGERERSAHKAGQTELHSSPEAGASRDTAGQTGVNVAENCCKFSIFINPQSPRAGVDARAPRMYVVQSFCTSL